MTVRESLKLSVNTIAAQIGAEIGPGKIARTAKRFGVNTPLRANFSISLGSSEVNLVELIGAYLVFPNEGIKKSPFLIKSIKTTSDRVLYTRRDVVPERVYAEPYARQITQILQDVIETGTGHGARLGSREAGGKTGTSQDYRDAWFIGFTSQYTTGVWLGNDDNSPTLKITGGLLPVDIWKSFMLKAHKGLSRKPLLKPDGDSTNVNIQKFVDFYATLTNAFTLERNIAAGIVPPDTAKIWAANKPDTNSNPPENLSQN